MGKIKMFWQEKLVSQMPPEEEVRNRNTATSASYAGWFQRHPDWFRWAGMVSFASYRVGILLAMYDYSYRNR